MTRTGKLAAILVAASSAGRRLVGSTRTLARLRVLRSYLADPAIGAHHGHIVKRTDGGVDIRCPSP